MKKFFKLQPITQAAIVSLAAILLTTGAVLATTTIGSNISTDGSIYATSTLVVTGATTLYSALNASSTLAVTGATTLYNTLNATTTIITANNIAADVLTVEQDAATGNIVTLKDGSSNVLTVGPTGDFLLKPTAVSIIALSVKNTSSKPIFDVNTTNSYASTTEIIVPQANSTSPMFEASSSAVSIGDGTAITRIKFGSCTASFGAITASSTGVTTCSAPGVSSSDQIFITPYISNASIIFSSASSTTDNINIAVYNTGWARGVYVSSVTPTVVCSWMAIK